MGKKQISKKWRNHKGFKKPFDYHLEDSDQDVTLRRLDMPDLLKLGIADEMDLMSKALMSNPQADDAAAKVAVADAVKKADSFQKVESMINKVVMAGCLDPHLVAPPINAEERVESDEFLYIDEIPWEDRMELFSVIFETEGLSDFREEQEPGVGNMEHVQDVQLPADGPVADVQPREPEGVLSE